MAQRSVARRAIVGAKHRSQWPVIGWVAKIYYLELLRASEGTLSCWSRLHFQSLAPTPVSRRVDVKQAAVRKIVAESLSQHDEKHVVPAPLNGIRVRKREVCTVRGSNTKPVTQ
jgi:phosphomannomutase